MFHLIDDGTLDTVVECDYCDLQERFDSWALLPDNADDYTSVELTFMRIAGAIEQATDGHDCPIFDEDTSVKDCPECGHIHNADGSCGLVSGCECHTSLCGERV